MNKGDFPDDTFTENDVFLALEGAGLHFKNGSRYILSQCPTHEDAHPSVQIYKDDWFVNCHAGCGRFHITKAFPALQENSSGYTSNPVATRSKPKAQPMSEHKYKQFDLTNHWKSLAMIPRDHNFKTIPLEILDNLGWRYVAEHNQYFIPYFSRSRESIPFAQYRNLDSNKPRFIFLKDAKPTCYGTWNLVSGEKIFIVEGCSDAAVLEYCAVPYVAMPSAASTTLMRSMVDFAVKNAIQLVYAGDRDDAGDKLRATLDEIAPYRLKQVPIPYKDWGEFLEATDSETVQNYCFEELFPK